MSQTIKPPLEIDSANNKSSIRQVGDFDISQLRLSQDFSASIGLKKILTTVPIRKPDRQAFFRVHPDQSYRLQTAIIEVKEERGETYLVDPTLWPELAEEIIRKTLYTAI